MKIHFAVLIAFAALPLSAAVPVKKSAEPIERVPNATRAGTAWSVKAEDGPLLFTEQIFPTDVARDARAQADQMIDALGQQLTAAGGGLDRVMRLNVYVADDSVTPAVEAMLAARFR